MRDSAISFGRFLILAAIAQAIVVAVLFRAVFFARDQLLGIGISDLHTYYYFLRAFGFGQIAHGHFPFWNPYSYSGAPFFGNPEASMLFLPNYVHLFLSPAMGMNFVIVLHVFLAGFFAAIYLRNRKYSVLASIAGGVAFSLSSGIILRVYGGHIAHVCTIAYAPLIFFCVDRLLTGAGRRMVVLLALAIAFQSLGGEPQIAYYTALGVLVYLILEILTAKPQAVFWKVGMVALAYLLALGLTAVQLLPEMHVSATSVRGGGTSLRFSSTDPVPPEDFLELLAPEMFGNEASAPYIGRYTATEVRIYCGSAVALLAIFGALRWSRNVKVAMGMCAIFAVISFGAKTPVYIFLFHYLPGFGLFRESGRVLYLINLFVVLLFAEGLDALLRQRDRKPMILFALGTVALWAAAAFLYFESNQADAGLWGEFVQWAAQARSMFFAITLHNFSQAPSAAAAFAATQVARAAGVASLLLLILIFSRDLFPITAAFVAVAELLWIASVYCSLTPALFPYPQTWAAAEKRLTDDQRILTDDLSFADYAMLTGAKDAFGLAAIPPRRYGQFLYLTQGGSLEINYISPLQRISPLLQILRCRFVLCTDGDEHPVIELKHPLPHLLLIGDAIVQPNDDAAFAIINSPMFNANTQVVLSQPPGIEPMPSGARGSARIISQGIDSLEIEADTPAPAILLITDSYDTGWHAKALPDSSQNNYDLILADYTLRAVPLAAGHHHLNIYYTPPGLYAGCAISGFAALLAGFLLYPRRQPETA